MPSIDRINELAAEFSKIRRHFHAHPELSNQEFETSKTIAKYLTEWGIEVHTGIGGTGVVGVLKNGDGKKTHRFACRYGCFAHHRSQSFCPRFSKLRRNARLRP